MSISIDIPENYVLPLFNIVVDSSEAGVSTANQLALITAQMLPNGTAPLNIPTPVGSVSIAKRLFGEGSMAERAVNAFFRINPTQQLWVAPVADPVAGVAAHGLITITSAPIYSGTVYLYIAAQLVTIPAYTTDTTSVLAGRLAAAINALTTLPVTATTSSNQVNLTCRWTGDTGNDVQMSFNYYGQIGGQAFPVGFAAAITPMSGGTGQPDFTAIIGNIAPSGFVHVALPYSDTASLNAWDQEYGFGLNGRWSYQRQQYGWLYNSIRADYADALYFGGAHNSAVISTMVVEPSTPSPVWEVAASYCALGSYYLSVDPARPLQTLVMEGILPALASDRFSTGELNNLATSGLAIQSVNPSGKTAIVRESLQYQYNSYGQADGAFALVTILATVAELNRRFKSVITSKYPRHKLAQDGTKYGAGQAIVTPNLIKGELVAIATKAAYDGLIQNLPAFIGSLVVEIDDNNPNRLNCLLGPQLIGQLRQFNALMQFRLVVANLDQ